MSENSKDSKENINTQEAVKTIQDVKICPKCGNNYQKSVNFCFFDGNRLETKEIKSDTQSKLKHKTKPELQKFKGFSISTHQPGIVPLQLIQSTTKLLLPSPKLPTKSTSINSHYFSLPFPRPKRNFLIKTIDHVGFSKLNLWSYFTTLIFTGIIYGLWLYNKLTMKEIPITGNEANIVMFAAPVIIVVFIILVLPVITLGYTLTELMAPSKDDYRLKVEPTLLLLTIFLNSIIIQFAGPLPILLLPGEIKTRGSPPRKELALGIQRGITPAIIVGFISLIGLVYVNITGMQIDTILQINLEFLTLFVASILLLILMPFGTALGRIIQKENSGKFYLLFMLVIFLIFSTMNVINIYEG